MALLWTWLFQLTIGQDLRAVLFSFLSWVVLRWSFVTITTKSWSVHCFWIPDLKAFWRNEHFCVKCLLFFPRPYEKGLGFPWQTAFMVRVHLRFLPKNGAKLHRYVTKTFVQLHVLHAGTIKAKLSLSLFPNQTLICSMSRDLQLLSRKFLH